MFKSQILADLKKAIDDLGYTSTDIVCSIPKNSSFGDYTTNVALQLAKLNPHFGKQNSQEIANEILRKLGKKDYLEKVEVAGNGFINFYINPQYLMDSLKKVCDYSAFVNPGLEVGDTSQKIMVEFTDPNPFKEFHIGHLFSNSVGESLARLLQATGAEIKRVNYFGDVGMHVAKSIWGMKKTMEDKQLTITKLESKPLEERIKFLGDAYVVGAKAYEEDLKAQKEIVKINQAIYLGGGGELYDKGRKWSLEYFETIYELLGTKFDYYYPESEVAQTGKDLVKEHTGSVFEASDGAIIFDGEKFNLHKRVFINSLGLPTYEAKELGLAVKKYQDYKYDRSIVVTGNEIREYFQVLLKALEQVRGDLAQKTTHIPHGMVRMIGVKMSSRKGNVLTFEWLFEEVSKKVSQLMKDTKDLKEEREHIIQIVTVGAIKFSMLKSSPHMDVTFDLQKSVSLQGDSGPYLQYSYARAKSVLRNANYDYQPTEIKHELEKEERELLRSIEHFPGVIEEAAKNLQPNTIATFLLTFAKDFNLFYQKHPIIRGKRGLLSTALIKAEEKSEFRLALTCAVAVVLKQGLYLLGIEAPERM